MRPSLLELQAFEQELSVYLNTSFDSDFSKIVAGHENVKEYITAIKTLPLLSKEEELAIYNIAKTGDDDAIGRLIGANLYMVVLIIKQYYDEAFNFTQFITEGNEAIIIAFMNYEAWSEIRFSVFAAWYITEAVKQCKSTGVFIKSERIKQYRQELGFPNNELKSITPETLYKLKNKTK